MMQTLERFYRRIAMLVGRGRIKYVDDLGPVQLVQVRLGKIDIRDNTPRVAEYGLASNPPENTDGVVISIGGDRNNCIVIATNHQPSRMTGLQPGEVAVFDNLGQSVYLTRTGIVINGAGMPVKITNTPEITHDTPLVYMTGDLKVKGDIYDRDGTKSTLQHVRDNYDVHTHNNVQPGAGNSGAPNNTL